ncbi:malto-oligosyltrehalose synthase [Pengzhenrongella sicca]|uniref:Malto-oligosyltrehalose synthase n=1 Tax=Pengzhenrongella sicca TaxID=2819238 RepID=A0A8A4ZCU0_9MICO|nr:malto-oligosyltrehalose synthase [Pengzhenrongella sicca]QTE28307.1 malto-oligosyltrehalose synthase [Pengzhenrongella sicca]
MSDTHEAAAVASDRRRPAPGHAVPVSTYRLQLGEDLTLDDAAARVPYLADLGVTHLYLSPILRAAPGSTHGYDVVDHTEIAPTLGGRAALDRLATAAHARGLGMILDIVPNHMAVPTPVWHNRALWSVLAHGAESEYAAWFDVDWSAGEGALLMPVLGDRIGAVLAAGELVLDRAVIPGFEDEGEVDVLRYHEHMFPVRAETAALPLGELVDRQHYRLAFWRVADEELNYRRFFDVGTLAAIRVEDPDVFDATHALVLELLANGTFDGLRIDHPDGLADPAGYLARLSEATGGAWVAVEKILAGDEELPGDWVTVGTTGYEGLWRLQSTFVDPGGATTLGAVMHRLTGDTPADLPTIVISAKREIVDGALYAEVHRLTELAASICREDLRLRDHTWRALQDCLVELLVAFDRYRAYVVPGQPVHPVSAEALLAAAQIARGRLGAERSATIDVVVDLLLGREAGSAGRTRGARRDELIVRFQQTCGAVMAKGVEDTAFYRWTHEVGLCEVGGEPGRFSFRPEELHAWAAQAQRQTPVQMTTLSTHDTKRGEDTRARLGVLTELSLEWATLIDALRAATAAYRTALLDGRTENLLWQTLAGTWSEDGPIEPERLTEYLIKATREAKTSTRWTAPDEAYETALTGLATRALADPNVVALFADWVTRTRAGVQAATLGTKLVQLTLPGVADVYQGSEVPALTLVDPDNRRPVDHEDLAARLARLDDGAAPRDLADEKLLITSRALRLRRDLPEAFVGLGAGYSPLPTSTGHALAFARTVDGAPQVVTVATRLAIGLDKLRGWSGHTIALPEGDWLDVLSDRVVVGGVQPIGPLLEKLPVALLVRTGV